jgi:hypothetical protein
MWSFSPQRRSNTYCLFFFAAWQLLSLASFAQREKIDSLKKVLPTLKDTARIDCLNEMFIHYLFKGDKDSSTYYSHIAFEESRRINYRHGIAEAYVHEAGMANHFHNDFSKMEQMASEAIRWFSLTPNKKDIEIAYWQLGRAQTNQSNYDEALSNLTSAYEWAQRSGFGIVKSMVFETMTDIYRDRGEYVKLLETQQRLAQMDRQAGDTGYYSFHELWVLGLTYRLLEEYTTALPFWRKLFLGTGDANFGWSWKQMEYAELLTLAGQPDSALYYYNNFDSAKADTKDLRYFLVSKGEYYLFLKQYKTALPYFLKGLVYHRQLNERRQFIRTFLDLAKTYAALQKNDSAILYARKGLAMALQTKVKPSIRDASEILYSVYDRLQQNDSAYHYYHNYITLKEAVLNDQTRGKLAAYNYEHKIGVLATEQQLQQQQLKQATLQKKFLLFGIAGILFFGFILLRNIFLKRKNEMHRRRLAENELQFQKLESERAKAEFQLKTSELELQALRAQMNPHFIFNSLNSINRFILQNNKRQASEYLTKFSRLVRLILQNSQAALIPLDSELEALQLYLELEALRFNHQFAYKINIEEDLDVSMLKVPPLLIQPYVENAIWHGLMHKEEKGHLLINISQNVDVLLCKITDDGIGRKRAAERRSKSAATHKSMGMQITANRIGMLHQEKHESFIRINDLVLPDGNAGGTEVILKIPVTQ